MNTRQTTSRETSQSSLAAGGSSNGAEAVFRGSTIAASAAMIVLIVLIGVFLVVQAIPALADDKVNFLTSSDWNLDKVDDLRFGIYGMFQTTVLSSIFALVLAVPVAIGIAVFLVQYAPERVSRPLGAVIDLLAAVPSIIFGFWGLQVLGPFLRPVQAWLNGNLGWFFLFSEGNVGLTGGANIFTGGVVLAIMILPIITSISREVLRQTPRMYIEAAYALGATKWEMLRMTVFPYGRSGMIAASMLALGRALGETVAVLVIIRSAQGNQHWSLFDGGFTFAAKIAAGGEHFADATRTGAYIAAGLVLFILTFVVNAIARAVAGGKVNG